MANDRATLDALRSKAIDIGKLSVRMTTMAGSGHPSSALSLGHIVSALMFERMRFDPKDPWNAHADRLVLSEGHAVPIVYAAYAELGGVYGTAEAPRTLTTAELDTLRQVGSLLDGHPNPAIGFPFFDAATGSLGQGLSCAAGLAAAARLDGSDKWIYCLCGDGESREGQIWEAADFIADHNLVRVRAVFNCNGEGQADLVSVAQSADRLAQKLVAFGWRAILIDGHDMAAIRLALEEPAGDKPVAIVARTVKGWGSKLLQGKGNHGKPVGRAQLDEVLAQLDANRAGLEPGALPGPGKPAAGRRAAPRVGGLPAADFAKLLEGDGALGAFQKTGTLSTRRAYGIAIRELGASSPDVVVLDADVSNSTFSEYFKHKHGERFFECKIAEQNMISAAGGFAAAGKVAFASTFGKFLSRAFDQIEMCAISGHPLKIVGSHSGISLGADGPSQMSVTDIPFFRSFPGDAKKAGRRNTTVLNPACATAAYKLTEWMAKHDGMVYLRTMRSDLPLLYGASELFPVPGAKVLAHGKDLVIAATGHMVHTAKAMLPKLREAGIEAGLVDCYTFPIAADVVLAEARAAGNRVITFEDNYRALGSAVAEAAAVDGGVRVRALAVEKHAKSAPSADEVFAYVGLTYDAVLAAARELTGK